MPTISALTKSLKSYLEPSKIEDVNKAYHFAKKAHEGQRRRSGEPYITHPVAVAKILADMHMDSQSLIAAILHDVIEDTGVGKDTIDQEFGQTVAELVDGVSKLTQIQFETRAEAQAENFQKMVLAMAKDIRVILVKLADRLHNMRTLDVLHLEKRRRIALETLEIYAPIANRLGMNDMRLEFEELGFATLYPMRSSRIRAAVINARGHKKELLETIKQRIDERLKADSIAADVSGREKHLYSIYQKMRIKRRSFSEIMDVYAYRIIVDEVDTCYRVLGSIHNLFKPLPGRFKDYIAVPKSNGYQSLHTVLFSSHGVPIEIQIRTHEMEAMANSGIAAHWLYKSGNDDASSDAQARAREWLKGLLDMQQYAGNSIEFIENVKIDLFPDEVYLFTPKGEIFVLPQGATAVDFAYAVHTDVGNSCIAAKTDRKLTPLSVPLQSGQTVEIITAPGARPNPAWLNFIVTGKARSNIRHFLKTQRRSESVALGRRLLNQELLNWGKNLESISKKQKEKLFSNTDYEDFDDLLEAIGMGNQMPQLLARKLFSKDDKTQPETTPASLAPLNIKGTEGMAVSYGKCCHPIPGDNIVGHLSPGKGMVIHLHTCNNLSSIEEKPENYLSLQWETDIDEEFSVDVRIEMENHRGAIAELATSIASAQANIEKINMLEKDSHCSIVSITISIKDRIHLAKVIRRVRSVKSVLRVSRSKS